MSSDDEKEPENRSFRKRIAAIAADYRDITATIATNFTENRRDLKKSENINDPTKTMINATNAASKDTMATIVPKESSEFAKENLKRIRK